MLCLTLIVQFQLSARLICNDKYIYCQMNVRAQANPFCFFNLAISVHNIHMCVITIGGGLLFLDKIVCVFIEACLFYRNACVVHSISFYRCNASSYIYEHKGLYICNYHWLFVKYQVSLNNFFQMYTNTCQTRCWRVDYLATEGTVRQYIFSPWSDFCSSVCNWRTVWPKNSDFFSSFLKCSSRSDYLIETKRGQA